MMLFAMQLPAISSRRERWQDRPLHTRIASTPRHLLIHARRALYIPTQSGGSPKSRFAPPVSDTPRHTPPGRGGCSRARPFFLRQWCAAGLTAHERTSQQVQRRGARNPPAAVRRLRRRGEASKEIQRQGQNRKAVRTQYSPSGEG